VRALTEVICARVDPANVAFLSRNARFLLDGAARDFVRAELLGLAWMRIC
jgi:hypothetical protein